MTAAEASPRVEAMAACPLQHRPLYVGIRSPGRCCRSTGLGRVLVPGSTAAGIWATLLATALTYCLLGGLLLGIGGPASAADPNGLEPRFDLGAGPLGGDPLAAAEPVEITARVDAQGSTPRSLVITARLAPGWHLYSLAQKPGGPKPTTITVAAEAAFRPAGPFVPNEPPTRRTVSGIPGWDGLIVEEHEGVVEWTAPLAENPDGASDEIRGTVSLQLCRENACTPPQTIPFMAVVPGGASPALAEVGQESSSGVVRHVPERGHLVIEAVVGAERMGANGFVQWPLSIRLLPEMGWHLYKPASATETEVGQGKPTILSLVSSAGLRLVDVEASRTETPLSADLVAAGAVEGPVAFEAAIERTADEAEDRSLELLVAYQTCSDTTCDPPWATRLSLALPSVDNGAAALLFAEGRYGEAARSPLSVAVATPAIPEIKPGPATVAMAPRVQASEAITETGQLSLPLALLFGLIGGLILNLMPCVLPVLGLKLMAFAQQSGRARQEVLQLNLWYCAGLYAVFFGLATASVAANLGLAGNNLAWGEQFTSTGFNVVMAGIVFAFALSFLGVWEIPIPGFIGASAGRVQSQEGPAGSFLKGVLSTVLATPCSGPFLGPVFGFTLTQSTGVTYAVFAAIATGMALPYLLIGIMPGLVRFVPKPGVWMETLKEVLGFVMLGTVVFLFTFLDKEYFVPTFALLVGIWAACWWIGRAQQARGGAIGFGRWVQGAAVAAAVGTVAFLFLGPVESVIDWQPFSREKLAELRRRGATVMVDFSADWCATCKWNLAFAIDTPRVKQALAEAEIVPMLADWTDGSPEIKLMLESLQSKSIPLLALFPPEQDGQPVPPPIVLRDLITEAQVLAAIRDVGPSTAPLPEVRSRSASLLPTAR